MEKNLAQQYDALARAYDLPGYGDEDAFYATRQQAERLKPALEQQRQSLDERLATLRGERDRVGQQRRELRQELDSLEQRRNRIPVRNLGLRASIIGPLGIDEKDIPFVGELIQVRQSERDWEGAIERLLHNFGLDLLVPEHHYHRFSRYVNRTSLRARLVFHRVNLAHRVDAPRHVSPHALSLKLQVKPDTPYRDWVQAEIAGRFDYECCEDMEAFDRARKAMTPDGLIKSGFTRHEKDDRYDLRDPRRYILGWDNTDKIRTLHREREALEAKLQQYETALASASEALAATYTKQERLGTLLGFDDFSALDWQPEDVKLQALQAQKARLTQSSEHLEQAQAELAEMQRQIEQVEMQRQNLDKTIGALEHRQQQLQDELAVCDCEQAQVDVGALTRFTPRFDTLVHGDLTLAAAVTEQRRVETYIRTSRETADVKRRAAMTGLVSTMQRYKFMFPEETVHVDASIHALGDYERRLARIKTDDLPRYRDRFKTLLNEKILEHLTLLYGDFQRDIEAIYERIARLNASLRTIDYTPNTYIQLHTEPSRDSEVRTFKAELQACLPEARATFSETDCEAAFEHIRRLITRFREDARWTQKVTDVRHWLDFAASERYRENDQEKHYYSDSADKSGGQKAKLAYTILASAIAYQYGLHDSEARADAFRFVVIDEVFSRSDHENARYAMELFKELDLQLLVVTPMTALHVVEPYIAACHFVFNNLEGNHSQVENLELTQLHGRPAA